MLVCFNQSENTPLVARHNWNLIKQLWPLIVKSMPSEKPSIVALIAVLVEAVNRFFPTIAINLVFTKSCLDAAWALAQTAPPCDLKDFQTFIDNGENCLQLRCQNRLADYNATTDGLLDACINGNL